jgi:hypothetical protein
MSGRFHGQFVRVCVCVFSYTKEFDNKTNESEGDHNHTDSFVRQSGGLKDCNEPKMRIDW